MKAEPCSIGIFGGTFDPVHNGHVAAADSFLKSGIIDSLWIFLNPAPPHKNKDEQASYRARFKMLSAAFESYDDVIISDLETSLPTPCYTYQTVAYLKAHYPQHTFHLCIGKDSFLSFKSWYKWQQILGHCVLLVAERPTAGDGQNEEQILSKTIFVDHKPVEVSSTEVRQKVARGDAIESLVPSSVLSIIEKEKYYLE